MMEIFRYAREFMARHGNPNQWGPINWPPESLIRADIRNGDSYAALVFKAQALQIAKCVGELCVVLKGDCDAIILTGGVAYSKMLMDMVVEYVGFLAPVYVYPGENEMEALAMGGLRLLRGEEEAREWPEA